MSAGARGPACVNMLQKERGFIVFRRVTKRGWGCRALRALVASGVLIAIAAPGLGAAKAAGQATVQHHISVNSELVSVPVFVFNGKEQIAQLTPDQRHCFAATSAAFAALLPSEPYQPTDCGVAEIQGLTARDFRLFEDGVQQRIQLVIPEGWSAPIRDNFTWHAATSDTPSGIWSSTDLRADELPVRFWPEMYTHFYNLLYAPPASDVGCHRIRVEVRHRGAQVFARDEYCATQSRSDILSGTKWAEKLESDLQAGKAGGIPVSLQAGAFHQGPKTARVDISVWFPWKRLNHSWSHYRLHATIGILGEIRAGDGTLAGRFSDLLYPSYWPTFVGGPEGPAAEEWTPAWLPTHYETQLDLPPGGYEVSVVLSDGSDFGRTEARLTIPQYDPEHLALGSVVLCKRFRDAHTAALESAAANFAPQYVPLVSKGVQLTPAGDLEFSEGQPLIAYFEVYDPRLDGHTETKVQARIRLLDASTGAVIRDFGPVHASSYQQAGSAVVPIARGIPFADLPRGVYRVEVQAADSAGHSTAARSVPFTIASAASPRAH